MANLSEVYDPLTNTWTELPGLAEPKPLDLYPRAILAPNGQIFVVKNGSGKSAYMDVDTQTWTTITRPPPVPGGGGHGDVRLRQDPALQRRQDRHGLLRDRSQPAKPTWRKVGSLQYKRKKFSTVLLPDGRVMAIGGSVDGSSDTSQAVLTPEIWDPATETWSALPNLGVPRMYHSNALLLPDGRVLTAGGGRDPGAHRLPERPALQPRVPLAAQPAQPSPACRASVWKAGSKVSLSVGSANGLGSVVLMGLPAVTHGIDTSARRLVLPITSAYNPGTGAVTRAGSVDQRRTRRPLLRHRLGRPRRAERGPHRPGRPDGPAAAAAAVAAQPEVARIAAATEKAEVD